MNLILCHDFNGNRAKAVAFYAERRAEEQESSQ